MPVLLKQRVDAGDAPVPGVFQVFQRQSPILGVGLLALEPVLIDTVGSRTRRADSRAITTTAPRWRYLTKTPSTRPVKFKFKIYAESARVLRPHALAIHEFRLPRLHVAKQVRDDLIFFMRHAGPEVGHALVRLFTVS